MTQAPTAPQAIVRREGVALDRPAPNAKTIMEIMKGQSGRLADVATKHLTPEKLLRMIGVAMQRVPKLGNCTPISVLDCAMTCAELGLSPGVLGDAYLIPYKNACTVIIGYRGLMKLARRSGHISTIQAEVVREGDEFQWRLGMDAVLHHVPKAELSAKMTHAWAMAKFRDGSFQFVVMRAPEVLAIKQRSAAVAAGNKTPWTDSRDEPEMWKKTALRRLCKMLPLTPEIESQIASIDTSEQGRMIHDFTDLGIPLAPPIEEEEEEGDGSEPRRSGAAHVADVADVARLQLDALEDERTTKPAPETTRPPTAEEQARRAQAIRLVNGCTPGENGCAAEASVDAIGKKRCANHAAEAVTEKPAAEEKPTEDAGSGALPGMGTDAPTPSNRPRKK